MAFAGQAGQGRRHLMQWVARSDVHQVDLAQQLEWSELPQVDFALDSSPSRQVELVLLHAPESPRSGSQWRSFAPLAALALLIGVALLLFIRPAQPAEHRDASKPGAMFAVPAGIFHVFDGTSTTTTATSITTTTVTTQMATFTATETMTSTMTTETATPTSSMTSITRSATSTTFTTTSTALVRNEAQLTMPGDICSFDFDVPSATSAAAKCFCNLAGNPGCSSSSCACPQGCAGTAWNHPRTVTFINRAEATSCNNGIATALLTIPKSYMRDIGYLKFWCARGARVLLTEMIREGFRSYQEKVRRGPVRHCLHSGAIASVPWLHLHTIGVGGIVDNMFETNDVVWCHDMRNMQEAEALAGQIIDWAGGPNMKEVSKLPMAPPSTCAVMGCGTWGPKDHCSCDPSCREFGICCKDYEDRCFSTCRQIGCGNAPSGSTCTCEAACKEGGTCCVDAPRTCKALWTTTLPKLSSSAPQQKALSTTHAPLSSSRSPPKALASSTTLTPLSSSRSPPKALSTTPMPLSSSRPSPKETYRERFQQALARNRDESSSSCMLMGCGQLGTSGGCSCHASCEQANTCCHDFGNTCRSYILKKLRRLN